MLQEMLNHASDLRDDWFRELACEFVDDAVDEEIERQRRYRCADWAVHTVAIRALRECYSAYLAQMIVEIPKILDCDRAGKAFCELGAVQACLEEWPTSKELRATLEILRTVRTALLAASSPIAEGRKLTGVFAIEAAAMLKQPPSAIELIRELMEIR